MLQTIVARLVLLDWLHQIFIALSAQMVTHAKTSRCKPVAASHVSYMSKAASDAAKASVKNVVTATAWTALENVSRAPATYLRLGHTDHMHAREDLSLPQA
mmetsp:Transcript_85843/g.151502  ORF Transcript_85843/g.151502 Transcript_85843/m.151502 type:complete len:101 (-) Transcript_85843:518-820(-)